MLSGGFTVWGSFQPWASIAGFDLVSASGVAMGEGVLTAMLGLVALVVGAEAARHAGHTEFRLVAIFFATGAFAVAVADIAALQMVF